MICPKFCWKPCPQKSEGAGKTGCSPHPRSRAQWVDSGRARAYRFGGITPAFPARRLYGLYEFAPVTGFLATVIPGKRWLPLRLDASTGASGPHDFTVRSGIVRPHIAARDTIASIATSPNVCDDGRRPSWRERMAGFLRCFYLIAEAKCFLRDDWTGGIALIGLRKLVSGRNAPLLIHRNSAPAFASHHEQAAEGPPRPISPGRTHKQRRGHMTVAQQAFLFTGEIFVLSFVAIYAMWCVDRLLRNFLR